MTLYTTGDSEAMANAIFNAYGPFADLQLEQRVFGVAQENSDNYDGGSWKFQTNEDGTLGFWYPDTVFGYSVKCPNYYTDPAMPPTAFGAACTLVAFNHLIWMLHQKGVDSDILDLASDQYRRLHHWIFDLSDRGLVDGAAVAGFID